MAPEALLGSKCPSAQDCGPQGPGVPGSRAAAAGAPYLPPGSGTWGQSAVTRLPAMSLCPAARYAMLTKHRGAMPSAQQLPAVGCWSHRPACAGDVVSTVWRVSLPSPERLPGVVAYVPCCCAEAKIDASVDIYALGTHRWVQGAWAVEGAWGADARPLNRLLWASRGWACGTERR